MTDPDGNPADPGSEALFASWLERVEAGEEVDLEELCRRHPEQAIGLRSLHGRWQRLQGALDYSSLHGTLASELARQFGSGVNPGISLEDEAPTPVDFPSEVLARLKGESPATTRYAVEGEVAHGGMGAVLRVWDADLRRHLAMKVMLGRSVRQRSGDPPSADPRLLARFLEEAQITGQLDHPGIVPVHELGLDAEGRVYFTMKLVQGRTLREVLDEHGRGEGNWTQARVLGLLQKVCEAMSYAHAKGVIHRDLKPSNVMVGRYGEVYVMDWGLAKVLGREDEKDIRLREGSAEPGLTSDRMASVEDTPDSPLLTMDGDVVGTPAYMPPEQARGDLAAMGPHSDVYAVGAMLYHLLAGHMPYVPPGERVTSRALWKRVREGPPQRLDEAASQAPPELVALCKKAMAREPSQRYADMSALSADLQAYLEGRVVRAYEGGAWAEARKWVRRNRALAGAVAGAVLALLVGGIAFAVKASEATRRADDVFRLSVLQDVQGLLDEARGDTLWPAHPDRIPALETWVQEARRVVADLPGFRAKRGDLRELALEPDAEEQQRRRAAHPDAWQMVRIQAELGARRLALESRRAPGPAETPRVVLDPDAVPVDAETLNRQAWWRVRPDRATFGEEATGLALAELALERVGDQAPLRAMIEDTLAWAWFALGRDQEALQASHRALEAAPEGEKEAFTGYLSQLEAKVEEAASEGGMRSADEEVARLELRLADLEARIDEGREWSFPDDHGEEDWWHQQLSDLVTGLELVQSLLAEDALVEGYGWSVGKRLAFARELGAGFDQGGAHARRWAEALPAIRAAYPDLDIEPQMGLVPIGPDPDSGLWEFAHLMSGVPARRRVDGTLELLEETGVVLVLLPGGTFRMGAQSSDAASPNYDPGARAWEGPVHEVRLSPFFLSKYEMTCGQWRRLTAGDPSMVRAREAGPSLLFPVETVSWEQATRWLPAAGLCLPSEAQWEYGARAGTDTPWFTGRLRGSVSEAHAANLADEQGVARGVDFPQLAVEPEPPDGYVYTAPVGSFAPNAFGLHDTAGNVTEYCRDGLVVRWYASSPWSDPVAPWQDGRIIVFRGGSWATSAMRARSAYRDDATPANRGSAQGVRPARELDPEPAGASPAHRR